MPTQACVVNTSMWYYCMGKLWKLRDLQPCWRRYVIISSGLWRFLATAYSCSFSASVYNLNEISQVPAPACTPCLSSYYLAFYDCVKYHNQNQLGKKGLFHFIISGKSSWEPKAGAEVLEKCCLLACFSWLLFLACFLIPSKTTHPGVAPNPCGMDPPTSIINQESVSQVNQTHALFSSLYSFFWNYFSLHQVDIKTSQDTSPLER